ncbi:MAG TPA: hypothetical protein VKG78_04140 [Opitutaceae bacterium]|nr:hypothetical protein [Opitutaceae bacterium]
MPAVNPTRRRMALLAVAGICCGLAGCRDRGVTSYRIPKEPDAEAATAPEAAAAGAPEIRWTAPDGWQPQAASAMRQGSYLVPGAAGAAADVSIVSFPGTGGDDLANINRWRDQLKLTPVTAAEVAGQVQSVPGAVGQFILADLEGAVSERGAARILGAWLRQPDRVWFFKMMGPSDLVGAQKDAFIALLQSVRMAEGQAGGPPLAQAGQPPANTNDLPRGGLAPRPPLAPPAAGGAGMNSIPVRSEGGVSLVWKAPADWQTLAGSAMRKASYGVGGAEVAITAFPGDVGGVLANVNRWRGQAGLEPVDEKGLGEATAPIESNGLHFLLVDAEGGSAPVVAALLPWNGATWFFKLTGPADAVARAKPSFISFLKTVRAP